MDDKDKKVVNTEEQNRTVNPGDSVIQEDSISQDAVENTSGASTEREPEPRNPEGGVETDQPNRLKEENEPANERDYPDL